MPMPVPLGLSAHLDRLDRALARLGPDGVADALRRHLSDLPPGQREDFLQVVEADAPGDDPGLLADVATVVDELPRAVDELVGTRWRRARRHRWDEWDHDDLEDSPVAAMVDDLYRRLGERFLAGDTATAITGYRRLFEAAVAAVDDPSAVDIGGRPDTAREAFARMVHGLLTEPDAPAADRATAAVDALDTFRIALPVPTVAEVIDARPGGLGGGDATLTAWRDACEREARALQSWEGRGAHAWLVDLVCRLDGPDALARLAADGTYPHRVDVYDAWIDQLVADGRLDDAIAAARQGLDAITGPLDRARLADRAVDLHRSAGDHVAAVDAGLRAVRDEPTLWRLRRLLDDADVAGRADAVVSELVDAVGAHGHARPLVRIAVLILAGRLDDLARVVTGADGHSRVWDDRRSSATVAAGALLLGCRDAPGDTAARRCRQLVDAVDRPGIEDEHRHALSALRQRRRRGQQADPDPGPLGPRLRAAVAAASADAARLAQGRQVVERTAEAVLGAKDRADYGTVAAMVVALAHTTEAVAGTPADDVIGEFDARYRRFSAFRAELRDAARSATTSR